MRPVQFSCTLAIYFIMQCTQCSICLSAVAAAHLESCSHRFHKPCIDKWIDTFSDGRPPTCPMCRAPIDRVDHNTPINRVNHTPIASYALECRTAARDWHGDEEAADYDSATEHGYSREDYYGPCSSDDEAADEVDFDTEREDYYGYCSSDEVDFNNGH